MIPDELQVFAAALAKEAINVLVPLLITFLVLLIRKGKQYIEARLTERQLGIVREVVKVSVRAAEQSGLIGLILNTAESKKEYAVAAVQKALQLRGITRIDVDEISDWIEAAIREGLQDAGIVEVVEVRGQ
ncbi:MAG: hypothetical protein KA401_00400 [Anaerolineae bacterium]|nr:hypothetical protein [Chloroflexota bacterium]MBP6297776.1 hypothetical protein [Anaerolineae bacterium]